MNEVSPALVVRGLCHQFGAVSVLSDVELTITATEVHCVLGPSGSGKSTLLRLVAGLEELQVGAIEIAGQAVAGPGIASQPPEARPVGFVFQDYALFPHLNVLSNVTFGMAQSQRARRDRKSRAVELLAEVDMADFADAMPHTLSGGQQQRVALARALARRPAVMLLDEPFSGLDGRLRAEVRERTVDVLRSSGIATVIVTHDPREALLVGDRVTVLDAGRVLQTGTPEEIYRHSVSLEVAEVFGSVNSFTARVAGGRVDLPIGEIGTAGFEDGAAVQVLVRADDLRLEEDGDDGVIVGLEPHQGATTVEVELDQGVVVRALELSRAGWRIGTRVGVVATDGAAIVTASKSNQVMLDR